MPGQIRNKYITIITVVACLTLGGLIFHLPKAEAQLQDSGSVGIEGTVPAKPPANPSTISVPGNGQGFSSLPVRVSGLCQTDLLVAVYKNNVFGGSAVCVGGNYSIEIDLFAGRNDLVARQFDDLNQPSPDSNTVAITFNDSSGQGGARIALTTAYSKRGSSTPLIWPLAISGGQGPYAVSVDWGDGSQSDLISRPVGGDFEIKHEYKQPGVYKIIVRATDSQGFSAFLQLVGVHNGPIQQSGELGGPAGLIFKEKLPLAFWIVIGAALPFMLSAFWLGKKHQLQNIRARLRSGQRPF